MRMMRNASLDGLDGAPRWIVMFLGACLIVQLFVLYIWNASGQTFSLQETSGSGPALSVTGMAGVDLWLCLLVLRSFPSGAPLRSAWMLITLSATARTASGVLTQFLGTDWLLNPLLWNGHAKSGLVERIWLIAQLAGGPVRLVLLAAAMHLVLRTFRKIGLPVRPGATDWAMSGIFCLYTVCRFSEAGMASLAGRPVGIENWISLAGMPTLCVLFLQAMLLRRSLARMGNGLITRSWVALVYAVLLTGAAEVVSWVMPYISENLSLAMFGSLMRLPIAAAFALVPAYQVATQCRAMRPASSPPEDLAVGFPELAQ